MAQQQSLSTTSNSSISNTSTLMDKHSNVSMPNNKKKRKLRLIFKKRCNARTRSCSNTTISDIALPPKKKQKINNKQYQIHTKKKKKNKKIKTLRKKKTMHDHHDKIKKNKHRLKHIKLTIKPRNKKRKRNDHEHTDDKEVIQNYKKRKISHRKHTNKVHEIKEALIRYHSHFRTNNDWFESVHIGDVIEWRIPHTNPDQNGTYIPVQIINRGYKAKIRYFVDHKKHYQYVNIGNRLLKNKNDVHYIRPKQGIRENPQENPWILEQLERIQTNNTRCNGNAFDESSSNLSSLWVQKGKEIEIYIKKCKQWVIGKIVKMKTFFEFKYDDSDYVQNKKITKYGESIINKKNFRLPLQCLPFTHDLVDYNQLYKNDDEDANEDKTERKRDIMTAIAAQIRIYLGYNEDKEGLFEGSWCNGLLYDIRQDDKTMIDVLYMNERMFKTIEWISRDCLFYFPIRDLKDIKHWISERPICDCTTEMMEILIRNDDNTYTNTVCYECKVEFVYNDSLWFCPKENTIRHHKKCFYLCSRCVMDRPCIMIHIDDDKPKHNSDTRCSYRYDKLVGGTACDSLQSPKILKELLHCFYHKLLYYPFDDDELMQLLDESYLNIEDDNEEECVIPYELKQLALQYLERSNVKALYYIYKAADYRYYHLHYALNQSKYIPPLLQKNEIVIQDTDSEDEPLMNEDSEDEPVMNNANEDSDDAPIRVKNERIQFNISDDDESDIEPIISTVQLDPITANLNNPSLAMPDLEDDPLFDDHNWSTDDNMDRFNDNDVTPEPVCNDKEEEDDDDDDDEDTDDEYLLSPSPPPPLRIEPYQIPGPPPFDNASNRKWMESVYNVQFDDDIAAECKAAKYGLLSIEKSDNDDIEIIEMKGKDDKDDIIDTDDEILPANIATYTAQQKIDGENVMWANTICVANSDVNNNEKRYNILRERGINPWFPGDVVRVYHSDRDIWLNGKVIETMWNPKAKYVLVHHYDLPWIVDKKYEIFSLKLVGIFSKAFLSDLCNTSAINTTASDCNKKLLLIDRLKNGTPIKVWGPPWRYGRVLWRWNDADLVCIQFNAQNIDNCKTFHAHNKRWKMTILSHDALDTTGCRPPPTLKMAKSIDVTLTIDLISSDSDAYNGDEDMKTEEKQKEKQKDQEEKDQEEKAKEIEKEKLKKKEKKKKKNQDGNDSDYLYDDCAKIDNVDDAAKFKELQDNFMEYILNENDDDIDRRGLIIDQCVDEEINKKYDLIEIVDDKKKKMVDDNMIHYDENEFNDDGTRKFYKTRNKSRKIKKIKKIKKYKLLSDDENDEMTHNILVYGIDEGSCFYPQQNVLILWKFMNENHCNITLEFELNLQHKQYLNVIPKGKKKKKLSVYWDKISLLPRGMNSIWIKCNSKGEYMYNTQLPKDIECNQDIYKMNICLKNDRHCFGNSFEFEVRSIMCCANLQQQFVSALNTSSNSGYNHSYSRLKAESEYNLRNKDYSKDNGVWCPCGAISTTREDYESDFSVEWIQCDECKTWQHIDCLQLIAEANDIYAHASRYLCPWCNNTCNGFSIGELKPLFAKFMKTIWMLNEACCYRRKSKVIYGNSVQIIDNLNLKSMDDLKKLGLNRGLLSTQSNSMNKAELISILTESPIFARTPNNLAKYVSTLICGNEGIDVSSSVGINNLRLADLMAGNGNITQWLPGYHILAVEKNKQRYESGRRCVQRATWLNCDIFSEYFIKNYVFKCKPFDIVVSNPDFEYGFAAIYVGLLMIRGNPDAKLIYVLPMDFFCGTKTRQRLYRICNFHIEKMYSVGRWNYYKDRYFKSHPKIHCDCVYIIKPGKYSKFSCIMKQALLAKDMINHEQ